MRYTLSAHLRAIAGFLVILVVGLSYRYPVIVAWLDRHIFIDGALIGLGVGFHFFNVYYGRRATWGTESSPRS